jgi:sensor histidine kinase YesM
MDDVHRPLTWREIAIIFTFWTLLAVLSSANWLLDPRGPGFRPIDPSGPVIVAFLESWTWAALTPLIFRLSSRFSLARASLLIVIGIAVAIGVYLLVDVAREIVFAPPIHHRRFRGFVEIGRMRFVPQLLFFFAILAVGYAREYFLRDQERQAHAMQLQAQLAEARLDALRMQINPHFLFNTLNAVSALVDRDPSGVRKMIARLSELLRTTTDSRASDEVPLRQELQLLDRYIEIMEIRFQGRLRVEREIEPATLEAKVPNLVLQPIVENALEHGASRAMGEGVVRINARRDGERLVITVRDNGPGVAARTEGVGLGNTRARLAQLYGDSAGLTLTTAPEGGALAEIVLPFRSAGVSPAPTARLAPSPTAQTSPGETPGERGRDARTP